MDTPAWLKKTSVKKKSAGKEKSIAKELGGKAQPGSGNQFNAKGDVKLDDYLIEHKYTDKKSYSLNKDTFKKIEREAQEVGKCPAMIIELQDRKLVVLRYEDVT